MVEMRFPSGNSNMGTAKFDDFRRPGILQDLILKLARIVRRVEDLLDAQSGTLAEFTTARFILEKHQDGFGNGFYVSGRNHESGDAIQDCIRHATVLRDNGGNTESH